LGKGDVTATALAKGVITPAEAELIHSAEQARLAAISVDDFSTDEILGR